MRTLRRLEQFDLACEDPHSDMVAVRRNVPPINPRHLRRLPHDVQLAHAEWAEAQLAEAPIAAARRRARRVAFTLLEQGDDPDHVERVLHAMGFHPALCHESAPVGLRPPLRGARARDTPRRSRADPRGDPRPARPPDRPSTSGASLPRDAPLVSFATPLA